MARRCRYCERPIRTGQQTVRAYIHDTMYTVHAACRDLHSMPREQAEARWDYRTLRRKKS